MPMTDDDHDTLIQLVRDFDHGQTHMQRQDEKIEELEDVIRDLNKFKADIEAKQGAAKVWFHVLATVGGLALTAGGLLYWRGN